ncbi:TPA: hypothetical protein ACQ431_003013 [Citrobacter murliniae]
MKIFLVTLFLLLASPVYFAQASDFSCSVTHHIENADGSVSSEFVGSDVVIHDSGNSFSLVVAGQEIESPELADVQLDGEKAQAAKRGNLTFIKMKDAYVMRAKNEGYVINECE